MRWLVGGSVGRSVRYPGGEVRRVVLGEASVGPEGLRLSPTVPPCRPLSLSPPSRPSFLPSRGASSGRALFRARLAGFNPPSQTQQVSPSWSVSREALAIPSRHPHHLEATLAHDYCLPVEETGKGRRASSTPSSRPDLTGWLLRLWGESPGHTPSFLGSGAASLDGCVRSART